MQALRAIIAAALLAGLVLPAPAPAAPAPLSGRVFTDAYIPLESPFSADFLELSTSLWLTASPVIGGGSSSATFTLEVRAARPGVALSLREAYASHVRSGVEMRVGRQILPWGKSDGINPTDFLSAKDYTRLNPDEEVRRVGTEILSLAFTPNKGRSPLTLTGVWALRPAQSTLLIPASALPAGLSLPATPVHPAQGLGGSELALKAALSFRSWDMELIGFQGWSKLPELTLSSGALTQTFRRISAVGIGASASALGGVFRLEGAYTVTEDNAGINPLTRPTHLDAVFGVEFPLVDELRFQAQLIYQLHPNWSDPAGVAGPLQAIALGNALLLNYQYPSKIGYTARLSYLLEDPGIEAELFGLAFLESSDFLLRPRFTYAWSDAIRTTVGADWYGGPGGSPLGALDFYNSVFLEAKYTF